MTGKVSEVNTIPAIFSGLCPNCGGDIDSQRLQLGIPCEKCLPNLNIEELKSKNRIERIEYIARLLEKRNLLKNYSEIYRLEKLYNEFEEFFKFLIGNKMWSAQRSWARRIFLGRNFSIIAPTGMGKTSFGAVMSLFLALRGKKCYIMLPTSILVRQVADKIQSMIEKGGYNIRLVYYHSLLTPKQKREMKARIMNEDYDILITTSFFLAIKFEEFLKGRFFDFIFVDDVDAFVKTSKNVDKVLMLLGFTEEIIDAGMRAAKLVTRAFFDKSAYEELRKLREEIAEFKSSHRVGMLVVSGASARAKRTLRVKLFKELLNFEVGRRVEGERNVVDAYLFPEKSIEEHVVDLVKRLGKGGLVFAPMDKGSEYVTTLAKTLKEHGIKAEAYTSARKKLLDQFVNGEIEVLVGVASYRSPLARGLDLPETVRYAVFAGIPKFKISLDLRERFHTFKLFILLANIVELLEGEELDEWSRKLSWLRTTLSRLTSEQELILNRAIVENEQLTGRLEHIRQRILEIRDQLQKLLEREDIKEKIKTSPRLTLEENAYLITADAVAYLQASGRTSRMFIGGMTKGLSVLIVDNEKAFRGLLSRLKWLEDIQFVDFREVNIESLLEEIDRDRKLIADLRRGIISPRIRDIRKTALLIVESPNKARTIAWFFGEPTKRTLEGVPIYDTSAEEFFLTIAATGGHVVDLTLRDTGFMGVIVKDEVFIPVYSTIKRCMQCGYQFLDSDQCPNCKSKEYSDSLNRINAIRELAEEADIVLIGTDPDTEGEKIAWDIAVLISPYAKEIRRVEFHEVTRKAVKEALHSMRDIDLNLVKAQIIRRIEDRWIGFSLTETLWKSRFFKKVSAGRVQTPVLGWILERYKEYKKRKGFNFKVTLENNLIVSLGIHKITGRRKDEKLEEFKQKLLSSKAVIEDVKVKEDTINPPPPYTTDEMIRDASRILRLSPEETMRIAQSLFEAGLITYHRTDSHRVSTTGIGVAKSYIEENIDASMFKARVWGEGGAHECIRPTRPIDTSMLKRLINEGILRLPEKLSWGHYALYDIIFKRFIASQMIPGKVKVIEATVKIPEINFETKIEGICQIIEEGFTKMYKPPLKMIPEISEGEYRIVDVFYFRASEVYPYTEGEVVDLMRKRGIGRPSTYAAIISILKKREYVRCRQQRLIPTQKAYIVYSFLTKNFSDMVSEERTRLLENYMRKVEEGELDYIEVLKELYREVYEKVYSEQPIR
ncbi:reverse gyrase [archaeon]|nr:MAG: reverse gyrase [archaeon]